MMRHFIIVVFTLLMPSNLSAKDADAHALLAAKCSKCHGEKDPKGGVHVLRIGSEEKLAARAELLQRVLEAVDSNDMPPESEPQFTREERESLVKSLKDLLKQATASSERVEARLHRLTRFQYNNTVRDLFRLDRDVFELPEKLMTRRDRYLPSTTGKMPERVQAVSQALQPAPGLNGVQPFPKDLRAEHGFDNQANKLTLSPLLLDAFLKLSVSIVESPDFNPQTVGIWNEFFSDPGATDSQSAEIERRLKPFLRLAFRRPVEDETLRRYIGYVDAKLKQGASFTDSMKKVASAVMCSPMFLYRSSAADGSESQFELASQLSFFLWASIPDAELLDLAERGELSQPATLRRAVDRLMTDQKIERFLDTFPSQWLQLENLLAVTPDPKKSRYFRLDENYPAGLPMLIEPLLLFDAVFVENRPVVELVAPAFAYRSDFLRDWYESDLTPPTVNTQEVLAKNREIDERRRQLETAIADSRAAIVALVKPVREKLLAERQQAAKTKVVDLRPLAVWEFEGDLKDLSQQLDLTAHGQVKHADGKVVLNGGYLQSSPLKVDLKAKTLEVWCELPDVKQIGGGVMTIQGPGDFFDSIVLGERKPQHWISGSNVFARTEDFADSTPETTPGERLHLAMVYDEDGTTRLYRNGVPYGKPFRKGSATFPKEQSSVLFGLRHLPPGGNRSLNVSIEKARLYDRALTAAEVASAASGYSFDISEEELAKSLSADDATKLKTAKQQLTQATSNLAQAPQPQDIKTLQQELQKNFENQLRTKLHSPVFDRVPVTDPRYGGIITNAAVLSMTSGPLRTQPIARGSWIIEVVFNDPPLPPPNNVPPLKEDNNPNLTIREQFAAHRENASCAGCHAKIDPLGFALENFDITGRWRDKYENGRAVDASGTLVRKHNFSSATDFKAAIVTEKQRFARAFIAHLLRFSLARELTPADSFTIDETLNRTKEDNFKLQALIREVATSLCFINPSRQSR